MVRAAAPPAVSVSVAVFPLLRPISGNRAPRFAHIAAARHRRRPTLRPGGAGVYRLVPVAGAANRRISEICRGTPAVAESPGRYADRLSPHVAACDGEIGRGSGRG